MNFRLFSLFLLVFFLLTKKMNKFHLILHQNGKLFSILRNEILRNEIFTYPKCKEAEFILKPHYKKIEGFLLLIDDKLHKVAQVSYKINELYDCPKYWHKGKRERDKNQ